jgi:hypothetical protein
MAVHVIECADDLRPWRCPAAVRLRRPKEEMAISTVIAGGGRRVTGLVDLPSHRTLIAEAAR